MMPARYDLEGDIGTGTASAATLGAFLRDNAGPVDLFLDSPGGDAMEGAALMAEVERHGRVTVHVRGIAASAATLPMIAAREVVMHPAAMIMIHEPAVLGGGTADELRSMADSLDKMARTYAEAYARHTGHPVARIAAWMKAETWLTAEEALALNFCDRLEDAHASAATVAAFDYTRFRAAPETLVRLAKENGWATASSELDPAEK